MCYRDSLEDIKSVKYLIKITKSKSVDGSEFPVWQGGVEGDCVGEGGCVGKHRLLQYPQGEGAQHCYS